MGQIHHPEPKVLTKPNSVVFNGAVYQPSYVPYSQISLEQNRSKYLPYHMSHNHTNISFEQGGGYLKRREGGMIPNKVNMR